MFSRLSKLQRSLLTVIIIFAVFFGMWQISIAMLPIDVTTFQVSLEGLPKKLDGLRIVQLSDIHLGPFVPEKLVNKAVNAAIKCNPDIVVLTGDFVSFSPKYADKCMTIIAQLKPRYGVYAVAGNHDYYQGIEKIQHAARKQGFHFLINASNEVLPGFHVAGIDDESRGTVDAKAALRNVPKNAALLLITHEPATARYVHFRGALALTGHTHGGQINIPYITRSFIIRYFGFISGWYNIGKAKLYVNRGIGFNGIIPFRFRCNPEVSVFILHPAKR